MAPALRAANKVRVAYPNSNRVWSVTMKAGPTIASAGPPDDSDRNQTKMNKYGITSNGGSMPEITPINKTSMDTDGNIVDSKGGFQATRLQ